MHQQLDGVSWQGVRIVGVPMDLGQQRRGVDMGPSALRYAGLQAHLERLGYVVHDEGNLNVPVPEASAATVSSANGLRHLPAIAHVTQELYERAAALARGPDMPIFLGGDHSIALGTVAGAGSVGALGLLWIDAHADFNTPETTPSGNVHGMPVAALLGQGAASLIEIGRRSQLKPSQIVMIGVRDLDGEERQQLKQSGITVFTMREIDEQGIARVAHRVLDRLAAFPRLHISLDMDALDPDFAPGVGTPVPGGLSYREAHLLMELLAESGRVAAVDVVEINPILDHGNKTAELAVELVGSLLGKRIL